MGSDAAGGASTEPSHDSSTAMPHGFETSRLYRGEKDFREDVARKAAMGWRLASRRDGKRRRTIEAHYLRP